MRILLLSAMLLMRSVVAAALLDLATALRRIFTAKRNAKNLLVINTLLAGGLELIFTSARSSTLNLSNQSALSYGKR